MHAREEAKCEFYRNRPPPGAGTVSLATIPPFAITAAFAMEIRIEGEGLQALAPSLNALFPEVLRRLGQLDPALAGASPEQICVAEDFATAMARLDPAQATGGQLPASLLVRSAAGRVLLLDGGMVREALEGDIAPLIHLLHKEVARLDLETGLLDADGTERDAYTTQLFPICQAMWLEYAGNRRTLATLPQCADLLLPHLLDLLEVLPKAMAEDISSYYLDQNLDALALKAFARLAHLAHTIAHAQGYLAGAGESLERLNPEFAEAIAASMIGPLWQAVANALDAIWRKREAGALEIQLRSLAHSLQQLLATLGLDAHRGDDGALWLEVRPLSAATLQEMLGANGAPDTLH